MVPANPKLSASFDLLYKGVEIVTGGQRIHGYEQIVQALPRDRNRLMP
jgi:nondiscriminating aspartyl-tRNA synthetase